MNPRPSCSPTSPASAPHAPARGPWPAAGWPLALAVTIVLGSGNPAPEVPGGIVGVDKLVHFFVFGLLATLLARLPAGMRAGWRGAAAAVLATSLFGVTDELHQSLTPGRMMDFADWIADTAGALVAVGFYRGWPAYRRWLERPLFARAGSAPPVGGNDGRVETGAAPGSAAGSHVAPRG